MVNGVFKEGCKDTKNRSEQMPEAVGHSISLSREERENFKSANGA